MSLGYVVEYIYSVVVAVEVHVYIFRVDLSIDILMCLRNSWAECAYVMFGLIIEYEICGHDMILSELL